MDMIDMFIMGQREGTWERTSAHGSESLKDRERMGSPRGNGDIDR